jgi:hypothetical protein
MKLLIALLSLFAAAANADSDRALQAIADWDVSFDSIEPQGFTFSTGGGAGTNPNVVIKVYDICRTEGAARVDKGQFYPSPGTVGGILVDSSGVVTPLATPLNVVTFGFAEGIAQDVDLYTSTGTNTATVEFCAEVGLYEDTVLINFAEVKLTYNIDLITAFTALTGYTVTQASVFNDPADREVAFDGLLEAYFCDPITHLIMPADATITTQGTTISVCFKSSDGQFEISDIWDLNIEDLATALAQPVITAGVIQSASTPYATKTCIDDTINDTNICVVTILLKAAFYDYTALTLTGSGNVILEFGDAKPVVRSLRLRSLQTVDADSGQQEPFKIEPQQFTVAGNTDSSATGMVSLAAIGAMAGAALAL